MNIWKSFLLLILFGLIFTGCEKQPIEVVGGGIKVESLQLPESLVLNVGDKGSFEVAFLPKDAVDASIVSLSSSDASVLKVSFDNLIVSYEAVSAGNAEVSVKVGDVEGKLAVEVKDSSSGDPGKVEKSGVKLEFSDGIRTLDGMRTSPAVSVTIVSGSEQGNYSFTWSVDGGAKSAVKGLFVNTTKSVSFSNDLEFGKHTVLIEVSEEKGLTDAVTLEGSFYVRGPQLRSMDVRFTSDYQLDAVLSDGVSLVDGEEGLLSVSWNPDETAVTPEFEFPSFVKLTAGESGRGFLNYAFKVSGDGSSNGAVRLKNVDQVLSVSGVVDSRSSRTLGIRDFTLPETLSVAYEGGKSEYTLTGVVPESAHDKKIIGVSSSNEAVLKVSADGLKVFFDPQDKGTADVTVKAGIVEKVVKVTVLRDVVVEDFSVPERTTMTRKDSFEYTFVPSPLGAKDAELKEVVSSNESVVKVTVSGFTATFDAVGVGEAEISATVGGVTKKFPLAVLPLKVTSFDVANIPSEMVWGTTGSYNIVYEPSDADDAVVKEVRTSDASVLEASAEGMTLSLKANKAGTETVYLTVGEVSREYRVTVKGKFVEDFSYDKTIPVQISKNETFSCMINTSPADADDGYIASVTSSDPSVLSVSGTGLAFTMRGLKAGNATVTLKVGGVEKTFSVQVLAKYVTGFAVPQNLSIALGNSDNYTFTPEPEDADDIALNALSSTSEDILKVEHTGGLSIRMTPLYVGNSEVKVTIGGVTKSFVVTCTGTVCTDIDVTGPEGKSLLKGGSADYDVVPLPLVSYDASTLSVMANTPSVMTVQHMGGTTFRFTAVGYGEAQFTATCGRTTKTFIMKAVETIQVENLSSKTEIPWHGSVRLKVFGSNAGWTYSGTGDAFGGGSQSAMYIERDGDELIVHNRSRSRSSLSGHVTVSTTLTHVEAGIDLSTQAVPNENSAVFGGGVTSDDKAYLDVEVKAGKSDFEVKTFTGFVWSMDAASQYSDIASRCSAQMNSPTSEIKDASGYVIARRVTFNVFHTVSQYDYYYERFFLPADGDGYGKYADGFGAVGYWSTTDGRKDFTY